MAEPQSNAALPAYPLPEGAPRAGVIHVRHRPTDRFTVVGNHLAQHPRLSATAIGLAVHIQSLPDGASVTVKALTLRFPEGETRIRHALNELEAAGYLARRRVPLGGGRFATRTFAYDKPGWGPHEKPEAALGRPTRHSERPARTSSVRGVAASVPAARPARPRAATDEAACRPSSAARSARRPWAELVTAPVPEPAGPAGDLLARLRLADPRLLLSARDIAGLAPAVDAWLARSVTVAQVTRTLTAGLPPEPVPIHHPARFLGHRLAVLLPPPLPPDPPPQDRPAPLHTCTGCDRAIRTHDPAALCVDCRDPADSGDSRAG